jgi:hypothetical protein
MDQNPLKLTSKTAFTTDVFSRLSFLSDPQTPEGVVQMYKVARRALQRVALPSVANLTYVTSLGGGTIGLKWL